MNTDGVEVEAGESGEVEETTKVTVKKGKQKEKVAA
jgi:hypothetical protein